MRRLPAYPFGYADGSQGLPLHVINAEGTGQLTPPAIGDSDGNRLTIDHESNWHECKAEEARFYGMRRVENLLAFSEDNISQTFPTQSGATIGTTTLALTGTNNSYAYCSVTPSGDVTGRTFIASATIQSISGATSVFVRQYSTGGSVIDDAAVIDLSDGTAKRVSFNVTPDGDGDIRFGIDNRSSEGATDTGATSVTFTNIQIEESTGRADTTTPSEYVSTGVATASTAEYTSDFSSSVDSWAATRGTAAGNIDSIGGENDWFRFTIDANAGTHFIDRAATLVAGRTYLITLKYYIPSTNSHLDGIRVWDNGSAALGSLLNTTDAVTETTFVATVDNTNLRVYAYDGATNSFTDAGADDVYYIKDLVITQIDHNANVDGVKVFSTLNGNSVASNVVTEAVGANIAVTPPDYVVLSGNSGSYVSTPDSNALDVTGDIDIAVRLSMDDWTPTAASAIIGKFIGAGNQRSYLLRVETDGSLLLLTSPDGTSGSQINTASTASVAFPNGTAGWLRFTLDVDDGAGNHVVKFYTSSDDTNDADSVAWTQLGSTITTAGTTSLYAGTAVFELGSTTNGAANLTAGKIHRAIVKDGIDGTIVADFNPATDGALKTPKSMTTPYNFGLLPGASGDYVSTPDSAALDITGDIDLIAHITADDYTSAGNQRLISKYQTAGQISFRLSLQGSGFLRLFFSPDGTGTIEKTSTVALSSVATDGQPIWCRCTLDVDNGASGYDVNFYYSSDGETWTQLGATVTTATATSIYSSTSIVELGSELAGTANRFTGKIFRAIVKDGIDGTVVADFNPATDFVSGTTMTSSSPQEEVWTANGNAALEYTYTVNGDAYLDTASSPKVMYGNLGLFMEGAATEISGKSNDFTSWTADATAAAVQDAIGLTGAPNEAWTLTDSNAAGQSARKENTTVANDSLTHYIIHRVAYNASPSVYPRIGMQLTGGTDLYQLIVLDPSNGTYNATNSDGAVVSVTREDDFWEVVQSLTNNTTGNVTAVSWAVPAFNTDGSSTGDNAAQGSTVFASCELYKTTYSHSPILTTGGTTKARSADVGYTIDSAYWTTQLDGTGSISLELTPLFVNTLGASNEGIITALSSNAANVAYFQASTAKTIRINDGANAVSLSSAWSSVLDTIAVKERWGSSTMRFSSDGTSSASATFDGSFNPSGDITLGKSLTQGMCIKNIILYSVDNGDGFL